MSLGQIYRETSGLGAPNSSSLAIYRRSRLPAQTSGRIRAPSDTTSSRFDEPIWSSPVNINDDKTCLDNPCIPQIILQQEDPRGHIFLLSTAHPHKSPVFAAHSPNSSMIHLCKERERESNNVRLSAKLCDAPLRQSPLLPRHTPCQPRAIPEPASHPWIPRSRTARQRPQCPPIHA